MRTIRSIVAAAALAEAVAHRENGKLEVRILEPSVPTKG